MKTIYITLLSLSYAHSLEDAPLGIGQEDTFDVHYDITTTRIPLELEVNKTIKEEYKFPDTRTELLGALDVNGITQNPIPNDTEVPLTVRRSIIDERNADGKLSFFQDPLSNLDADLGLKDNGEPIKVLSAEPVATVLLEVVKQEPILVSSLETPIKGISSTYLPASVYPNDHLNLTGKIGVGRRAYEKGKRIGKVSFFQDPLSKLEFDERKRNETYDRSNDTGNKIEPAMLGIEDSLWAL